jgi:hypothetical protein
VIGVLVCGVVSNLLPAEILLYHNAFPAGRTFKGFKYMTYSPCFAALCFGAFSEHGLPITYRSLACASTVKPWCGSGCTWSARLHYSHALGYASSCAGWIPHLRLGLYAYSAPNGTEFRSAFFTDRIVKEQGK